MCFHSHYNTRRGAGWNVNLRLGEFPILTTFHSSVAGSKPTTSSADHQVATLCHRHAPHFVVELLPPAREWDLGAIACKSLESRFLAHFIMLSSLTTSVELLSIHYDRLFGWKLLGCKFINLKLWKYGWNLKKFLTNYKDSRKWKSECSIACDMESSIL